jgi:hypothetical protein
VKTNHVGTLAAAAGALVAAGLLVLMLLVVVEARPAEATFPGKNGKIAYSSWDGQDYEIYTINPGGGGKFKVTHNKYGGLHAFLLAQRQEDSLQGLRRTRRRDLHDQRRRGRYVQCH